MDMAISTPRAIDGLSVFVQTPVGFGVIVAIFNPLDEQFAVFVGIGKRAASVDTAGNHRIREVFWGEAGGDGADPWVVSQKAQES